MLAMGGQVGASAGGIDALAGAMLVATVAVSVRIIKTSDVQKPKTVCQLKSRALPFTFQRGVSAARATITFGERRLRVGKK